MGEGLGKKERLKVLFLFVGGVFRRMVRIFVGFMIGIFIRGLDLVWDNSFYVFIEVGRGR